VPIWKQNLTNGVLRRDILPLSRHIEAPGGGFVIWVFDLFRRQ
jgi:hypothetical protein